MPFKIRCPCGRRLTAPDSAAGKAVRCPGCGQTFTIPMPTAAPPPSAGIAGAAEQPLGPLGLQIPGIKPRPPGASTFDLKGDAKRAAAQAADGEAAGEAARACPFCQVPCEPGAVICINCGLNFQTGERMATEQVKPKRERPKKNVLLVALQMVYRPFGTVDEIGGYAEDPMFVLWMWVFVAGAILLGTATEAGITLARQTAAATTAGAAASAAFSLAVLFPAVLVMTVVTLFINTTFCYVAGMLFGLSTGYLRLLLNLGFVGGVVRVGSLLLLPVLAAGLDIGTVFVLLILFFIWESVLYVVVLARYYDLPFFMALGIGVIAWLLKSYVGAGLLTWLQKLMGA